MRMFNKVITGAAVAAAAITLAAGVAVADPPTGLTPSAGSVVGGGSNTTEYLLDQLALNYDTANPHKTQIYSFDAFQGNVPTKVPTVTLKKGCAAIPRTDINGSSNGIANLELNTPDGTTGDFCQDFARSSRGPKSTDPTDITFVALALDNVTYASLAKGSNVPGSLTTAQLHAIYTCSVTRRGFKANTWGALLGKKAKKGSANVHIAPYLPQAGSGTLSFWEKEIGISVSGPGKCVTEPATLEENEGINPVYSSKNAKNILIPFSAGKWLAQAYHSPACKTKSCSTFKNQAIFILCKTPRKGQNMFGCDVNGKLGLNDIQGRSPTSGKGSRSVLNTRFPYQRTLYDVVRGTDSIPAYLATYFGSKGAFCSRKYASVISAYGFLPDPKCGTLTPG
jgi:ABC-type phosphate transport system substrate-binding protein